MLHVLMGHFDTLLGDGESLIKNETALDFSFIPKKVPFRELEQEEIANCVKPLFMRRSGRNLVVHGPPGVGKTVAIRHVIGEIEEHTADVKALYVNCWQKNSTFKIMIDLCEQLDYKFTHNKKTEELMAVVRGILNKNSAVFCFDEIDKVTDYDFLYSILEEIYRKSVILITNYKTWIGTLDHRIMSRLMPGTLEFKSYNGKETRSILQQRVEYAFVPGVWNNEAFDLIAEATTSVGDIRTGLHMLKEAALHAELKAQRIVTIPDAQYAIDKLENFTPKNVSELMGDESAILDIVKGNSGKKIGDMFSLYQENGGAAAYKTFTRKVKKLEAGNFIKLTRTEGGSEGNTTLIDYNDQAKKLHEF